MSIAEIGFKTTDKTFNLDYTEKTRNWLDSRYRRDENGLYRAHRPIYGFGVEPSEKNHTIRYGIAYGILKALNRLRWETALDVGGGEGYLAKLLRTIFNRESYTSEISLEANLRAKEFFGLTGVTADVQRLPFKDGSFDIVIASEVIEHLQYPHLGLYEMARVASEAVIITTAEAYASEHERVLRLKTRNFQAPHAERNYWHPSDFRRLFNRELRILTCTKAFMDIDERSIDQNEAMALVKNMTTLDDYDREALDALIIFLKNDVSLGEPALEDEIILERLFSFKVAHDHRAGEIAPPPVDKLCCPVCRGDLEMREDKCRCVLCNEEYPILESIPVLLTQKPLDPPSASDIEKAGLKPEGLTHIADEFASIDTSRLNKFFCIVLLAINLLIRYIASEVPWKIKFKWLRNKTNLSIFIRYFFK